MRALRAVLASLLSTSGGMLSVSAGGYKYAFALTLIVIGGFITGTLAGDSK